LVETLTQGPAPLATDVSLRIDFNPQGVNAYRLIGHESTAVGGLLPASLEADLHVGEETSVLLEVWLSPNDENDIADVHLSWTDAESGRRHEAPRQRISRVQFATSFEGSPLSLQAAAIAAETAEILRQSFNFVWNESSSYRYQPKPNSLDAVSEVVLEANPRLSDRPSFRRLVEVVESSTSPTGPRRLGVARSGVRGIIVGSWQESRD
jgi:hypothetical protein